MRFFGQTNKPLIRWRSEKRHVRKPSQIRRSLQLQCSIGGAGSQAKEARIDMTFEEMDDLAAEVGFITPEGDNHDEFIRD